MADMKFLHLSDLHLGKRVNEYSMLEDQEDILAKILEIVEKECPDGVLIAGDIYDKPVPGTTYRYLPSAAITIRRSG